MFDSHCHLHDRRLDEVREAVVARAVAAGVTGCRACGTAPGDWDALAALGPFDGFEVRRVFGVHPWFTEGLPQGWPARLRSLLLDFPEAWVGEIGLDAIRPPSPRARPVLETQLGIAAELGRPVALHGARAFDELLAACRPFRDRIPLFFLHGFSGSGEQLLKWLDFGASISFGGAAVHSRRLRHLAAQVPCERLFIETDSPDMFFTGASPAIPGTRLNQPANLAEVAKSLGI